MNPIIKLTEGYILIVFSAIGAVIGASTIITIKGIILVAVSAIGALIGSKKIDEGRKEKNIQNKLDSFSLAVLSKIDGRIFICNILDEKMNRLIDLNLVGMESFPSKPPTYGYCLTDLGRYILIKRIKIPLYPEILCDLIRVRYWEGYPADFVKKKEKFRKKYKVFWDESWTALGNLLKQGQKIQKDTIEIFNSFAASHNFETVMNQVVEPWLQKINKSI
jgi:hypothetical protein